MSFMNRIFGASRNNMSPVNGANVNDVEHSDNDFENMFVNNDTPVKRVENNNFLELGLQEFLEQNHFSKGFNDGYSGHSNELMVQRIKRIQEDFRHCLNIQIDKLKQELLKLQNHKIEIVDLSKVLSEQMDNHINHVISNIDELEAQVALSALKEGLVMKVIQEYREGYIQGTITYQKEKIVASSTGLY